MLRLLVLTSAALAAGMQTRETVQRVVLLRTTGSDLQPAATGYIYNKDDDGPESLVRMRESEVMEHLAKLYTHPAASGGERVIPVREDQPEHDGIADVDYKKIFDDYSANYEGSRPYRAYLDDLKRFKGGLHHEYDSDSAEDDKGSKNHRYGKKDGGSYHNAKFESYSISGGHKKGDGDAHNKHYHFRGSEDGAGKEDDARGFRGVHDDGDHKHEHEYFGKGVKAFADGHKYYGTGDRGHEHYNHEPKHLDVKIEHDEGKGEKSAEAQQAKHSSKEHSASDESPASAGAPAGEGGGRSYGYEVEH